MYNELPKYVIVSCSQFGTGKHGWRLHEVDSYCFAGNYNQAQSLTNQWKEYSYGSLVFMIKYENWLSKGGPFYDDRPFTEKRILW